MVDAGFRYRFYPSPEQQDYLARTFGCVRVVYNLALDARKNHFVLIDGVRQAGVHEVVFEAGDLPSGTYLYRLETPQGSFVKMMQLMK